MEATIYEKRLVENLSKLRQANGIEDYCQIVPQGKIKTQDCTKPIRD